MHHNGQPPNGLIQMHTKRNNDSPIPLTIHSIAYVFHVCLGGFAFQNERGFACMDAVLQGPTFPSRNQNFLIKKPSVIKIGD